MYIKGFYSNPDPSLQDRKKVPISLINAKKVDISSAFHSLERSDLSRTKLDYDPVTRFKCINMQSENVFKRGLLSNRGELLSTGSSKTFTSLRQFPQSANNFETQSFFHISSSRTTPIDNSKHRLSFLNVSQTHFRPNNMKSSGRIVVKKSMKSQPLQSSQEHPNSPKFFIKAFSAIKKDPAYPNNKGALSKSVDMYKSEGLKGALPLPKQAESKLTMEKKKRPSVFPRSSVTGFRASTNRYVFPTQKLCDIVKYKPENEM